MRIPARFNGPPGTGNGGYTAGLLASAVGAGTVEVTLRKPPPLDVDLELTAGGDALHGDVLIAAARPVAAEIAPVDPVTFDEAVTASEGYPGFTAHPFPTCFVCGPARTDGLALYPGILPDGRTATPWTVPAEVTEPIVWAALDCPGGWAVLTEGRPYVLGRITAHVRAVPLPGSRCVVTGILDAEQGRTATVRTTVHGPGGAVLAVASAVWVAVKR